MILSFLRRSREILLFVVIAGMFALLSPTPSRGGDAQGAGSTVVSSQGNFSYENATLTEDVTWSGTVVIRGYMLVASQATVRIAPGTTVRFMRSPILNQTPRLVVMGRLQCDGTAEQPVLFGPAAEAHRGDWRGILLLSSEKRNQCDNCRIEGAEVALEARYSTFTSKGLAVSRSVTGIFLQESTASLSSFSAKECATGIEAHDSELDLRDGTLTDNGRGIVAHRTGLVMSALEVSGSGQEGVLAEECGIKFSSCGFSGNGVGAWLTGGVGQIFMSRFVGNRDAGLHLTRARIKIQRSLFADNLGDGLHTDDGRGVVLLSAFVNNSGYNLAHGGSDEFSAVQNWWGSTSEAAIMVKLHAGGGRPGAINVTPWLAEKPAGTP